MRGVASIAPCCKKSVLPGERELVHVVLPLSFHAVIFVVFTASRTDSLQMLC